MIIVKIILWTLLTILILIALALAVPTRLFVRYTDEIFLQVRYLFLKITIPITDEQKAKQNAKKKPRPKKEKRAAEKSGKESGGKDKKGKEKKPNPVIKWLKGLYKRGGVDAIIAAFKRIASLAGNILKPVFRHLRLRHLNIDITVASDNAADTAINYGRLCAGVYPALTIILKVVKYDDYKVNIRPDFDKKSLETDISTEISLIPWVVIGGALHALVRFLVFKVKGEL